jgi:hypothetical protein
MGPQRQGELIYANLSWWRAAARSGNREVARLASSDDVCGLRWCSGLGSFGYGAREALGSFSVGWFSSMVVATLGCRRGLGLGQRQGKSGRGGIIWALI